jgi:hypothetical protein
MMNLALVLRDLEQQRFYGSLELKFEAGHVVLLRKTETIKVKDADCLDNRGASYDRNR